MTTPSRPGGALVAVLAAGLVTGEASALRLDFHPSVAGGYRYNSNVFLTASAADAQAVTRSDQRADSYYHLGIGAELKLTHSLQSLTLQGDYGRDRYSEYRQLDGSNYRIRGRADLALGSTLGATLTGLRERALQTFSGREDTRASFQTQTTGAAEFYYRVTPSISIKPEVDVLRYRYSLATQDDANIDEDAAQLSLEYGREKLSALGLKFRNVDGRFPDRNPALDGTGREREYTQRTASGYLDYRPSGLGQLRAEAGYTERSHDDGSVPDYSGATGLLAYQRALGGRTFVDLRLFRDLQSFNEVGINYVQASGGSVDLTYTYSVKSGLLLGYRYEEDKFLGSSVQDPANNDRVDRVQSLRAGIEYRPYRGFLLRPAVRYEDRDSSREDRTYNYALVSMDFQYTYGAEPPSQNRP